MASEGFQNSDWYFTSHNFGSHFHDHGLLIILIFFLAILIILLFLFLFALRRKDHFPVPIRASTHRTTIAGVIQNQQPKNSPGLDAATINSLPLLKHRKSEDSDVSINVFKETECSICLGMFEDEELVKVLPECLHAYHSDCVDEWLSKRSSCPLCRSSLDSSCSSDSLPA